MRILFISRCAKFDGTSSLSNVPRLVVHRMLLEDPHLNVTWLVPRTVDDTQLWKFLIAPLPEEVRPRLTFVKATGYGFDRMVGYFSTEEIWQQLNQARTDTPYDLVVTQQAPLVPSYKSVLMNRMMSSRYNTTTPWVIWHLWTATLSQMEEVPEYYMGEADVAAELMGCYHADLNIWESNYLLQDALRSMRKWFQPAAIKKVIANSTPVHVGVEVDRMDEVYARRMERAAAGSKPQLMWASRYANQKKPRISFEQLRKVQIELAAAGMPVGVTVSSSQPTPEWVTKDYHDWMAYENQDRDGWFNVLSSGDIVLCNSVSEGYGTTWIEMLAAGVLVVFEKAWWNEQLVPDWYPFLAETKQEQVLMAKELAKQYPDGPLWKQFVPRVREWVRAEQSDLASGPAMLDLLRKEFSTALEADEAIARGSIGQLVHNAALAAVETHGPVVTLDQVFAMMSQISESERQWGKKGDPISRVYLRRALQGNGWKDLGGTEPQFTREESVNA